MPPAPGEDPRLPSAARVACASRFSNSVGPVQIAGGLPEHTTIGAFYSTNATLVARYRNEWEFFGRAPPFRQDDAGPIDLGIEAGHSLAARGFVGELSLARRLGRVRLMALGRLLTDPDDHPMDVAAGGGAVPWRFRGNPPHAENCPRPVSRDLARRAPGAHAPGEQPAASPLLIVAWHLGCTAEGEGMGIQP
jgi:hypothetical protein